MLYICSVVRKRVNEGTRSPLFLYLKMFQEKVQELLTDCLDQRQDLFLIDLSISEDNAIKVVIDGDNGVQVEDCIYVSRAIEHNLDRDEHDFSLEVTTSGATSPIAHTRQYQKNLGRTLQVQTSDHQKLEGVLSKVEDDGIILKWKAREPKPVGKGKITVNKEIKLGFDSIKEAKVKLKF